MRRNKNGTPDMRFKENRERFLAPGRNVNGSLDMRLKENRGNNQSDRTPREWAAGSNAATAKTLARQRSMPITPIDLFGVSKVAKNSGELAKSRRVANELNGSMLALASLTLIALFLIVAMAKLDFFPALDTISCLSGRSTEVLTAYCAAAWEWFETGGLIVSSWFWLEPGMYFDLHIQKTQQCPPGTFMPAGRFVWRASAIYPVTHCHECPNGTECRSEGLSKATACPPGTFSNGGAVVCTECPSGHFQNQYGGERCEQCSAGLFQPSRGSSGCLRCGWLETSAPAANECKQDTWRSLIGYTAAA
eukprot:3934434-Rhodomonas_salina.1